MRAPIIPANWNGLLVLTDYPFDAQSTYPLDKSHRWEVLKCLEKVGVTGHRTAQACIASNFPNGGAIHSTPADQLAADADECRRWIKEIKPKSILGLGPYTLWTLKGSWNLEGAKPERGAAFLFAGIPCLCTLHPRQLFINYGMWAVVQSDYAKAWKHVSGWHDVSLDWIIEHRPTRERIINYLEGLREATGPRLQLLSVDIETDINYDITCIGIADREDAGLCIPFWDPTKEDKRYWSAAEEASILKALLPVLRCCPLVGQNAVIFDQFVIAKRWGIEANFIQDTMLSAWEHYCELPKSLAFSCSIYDDLPFWKGELSDARSGKVAWYEEFRYCVRDCIATLRLHNRIIASLSRRSLEHYAFNIRTSKSFLAMSLRGMRFDCAKRDDRLRDLLKKEAAWESAFYEVAGKEINVASPKQMKEWLYVDLGLTKHTKTARNKETGENETTLTSNYLTLLELALDNPDLPAIAYAGKLRKLKKRISTLAAINARPDGKVGYTLNCVGTVTGRATSKKPLDGFGIQSQNVDRRDRDLFLPEEGFMFAKADLEGADNWTVAAMCASLGDHRMLQDLKVGLKPAQAMTICHLFGHQLLSERAATLKEYKGRLKEVLAKQKVNRTKTDYDVFKSVVHGSDYIMGPKTMHENMFRQSDGEIFVSVEDCAKFQNMFFHRYPGVKEVHKMIGAIVSRERELTAASGQTRVFFGRYDSKLQREAMSFIPQANTGYATNLAVNWIGYHSRKMQLLNQVHDETDFQFRLDDLDDVQEELKSATQNELSYAGVNFSIPFEIAFGPDWGNCTEEIKL
jgi:DNA polymerase I-like protein with 3'-5' exonuclease and polymerase domains